MTGPNGPTSNIRRNGRVSQSASFAPADQPGDWQPLQGWIICIEDRLPARTLAYCGWIRRKADSASPAF
jgi:hypothetical protein